MTTAKVAFAAEERFVPLAAELGLASMGVGVVTLQPGQRNRVHRHREQEEVYVVLDGRVLLVFDDGTLELGPHDVARVAPRTRRQLSNPFDGPVVLLALGAAGDHVARDATAYADFDEPEDAGRPPAEQPLPPDLG